MDNTGDEVTHGDKNKEKVETDDIIHAEVKKKEFKKQDDKQVNIVRDMSAKNLSQNSTGAVNYEATIVSDDVIRAGGLGAIDDISSFLPVASDFTDFEANIRDAREYEKPQGEIFRHGLGWKGTTKETK